MGTSCGLRGLKAMLTTATHRSATRLAATTFNELLERLESSSSPLATAAAAEPVIAQGAVGGVGLDLGTEVAASGHGAETTTRSSESRLIA